MPNSKLRIGYIVRYGKDSNQKFGYREDSYTRRITSKGDRVYSDMLLSPIDYEDVVNTTNQIKEPGIVVVQEPFFVDDELRDKVIKWVEWANKVSQKEYDPFWEDTNETHNGAGSYAARKRIN